MTRLSVRTTIAKAALALATLLAPSAHAQPPSGAATVRTRTPADTLAWLAGCWRLTNGPTVVDEHWMSPGGGILLGMTRTVTAGRARSFEFLRIFAAGDTLVYAATPSGQQYTEFRAKELKPGEIVFENPTHDFPQRVGYRRTNADTVVAFIEGQRNGQTRRISFPYGRVRCG